MNITIKVEDWAAVVSAICAFVTLFMLFYSQRKSNNEKHEIVKANFYVGAISLGGYELCLSLKNRGYENIKDVKISLRGENGETYDDVSIKLKHIYEVEKDTTYDYEIILDYKKITDKLYIKGNIVLEYKDIYGEKRECLYMVEIDDNKLISGYDKKFLINSN
ncbi:hypothetical protein LZ906_006795 [Paraclostridium ghonii]|uniref:hypothetical protein n=1 Tax=Paraclostridium ghonii TaxID=29358 RepID=UPI00202CDC60|nr:hypothetical protein [Paeniclostridium ghonii]MCM0165924.1 hypothetical protein [Paeniclostridium ghonii]